MSEELGGQDNGVLHYHKRKEGTISLRSEPESHKFLSFFFIFY